MKFIVIAYDEATASCGEDELDLYGYLFNELDNEDIRCSMVEFETVEDAQGAARDAAEQLA